MTRKTYCGNLLWQSGLTLLASELGNASVGEEVTSGQVKVYAADTVDGLKTASALTEGVAIENKSAVKSTIQVTAPSGKDSQFFKVKFGE